MTARLDAAIERVVTAHVAAVKARAIAQYHWDKLPPIQPGAIIDDGGRAERSMIEHRDAETEFMSAIASLREAAKGE